MNDSLDEAPEPQPERYAGKVAQVGNSRGVRLDAAFFRAHPEFKGAVQATVVAPGQVLLSAKGRSRTRNNEADPVMLAFLRFLDQQMAAHPQLIEAADPAQLRRIAKLVKGAP